MLATYPGRMRPGLIEACESEGVVSGRAWAIRGVCAPASLKPGWRV